MRRNQFPDRSALLMPIPPRPKDELNGSFGPVSDQAWKSQTVLARTMPVDDTVTVVITAGAPFYQISDFWVGELELVSDPDGPHGPLRFWDETRVAESDGGAALSPTARQRLHVEIGVGIPKSVLPAGGVNGEVSISGAHFSL